MKLCLVTSAQLTETSPMMIRPSMLAATANARALARSRASLFCTSRLVSTYPLPSQSVDSAEEIARTAPSLTEAPIIFAMPDSRVQYPPMANDTPSAREPDEEDDGMCHNPIKHVKRPQRVVHPEQDDDGMCF